MSDARIFSDIHNMAPVDTQFVAGRWHADRVALGGIVVEARVFLKSMMLRDNSTRQFLLIGRARSGTTLLTRLLNGHSKIHCDGEVLKRRVLAPLTYLDRLGRKSRSPVYGAKLLSYQMVQVHRMTDPRGFLERLAHRGVRLIHLERDTFFQTLSLAVAQHRKQFHSDRGAKALQEKLRFDPDDFLKRLIWNDALLAYERAALDTLDHMHVVYERDLSDPAAQTQTLNRICTDLGVATEQVPTPLKKVLPADPASIVENYAELRDVVSQRGYAHLLPEAQA